MSKISGHFEITNKALNDLKKECPDNSLLRGIPTTSPGNRFGWSDAGHFVGGSGVLLYGLEIPSPSYGAVLRDLRDVYNGGHWSEWAQKHHFMRLDVKQKSLDAYKGAVGWIYSEAEKSIGALVAKIRRRSSGTYKLRASKLASCRLPVPTDHDEGNLFWGAPSEHVGNAVHALQDSFSMSHVERSGISESDPGEISKIKVYEGAEKEGHSHADEGWDDDGKFSMRGKHAAAATKSLVALVIENALLGSQKLGGWRAFEGRWLRVSGELAQQREDLTDAFIQRFVSLTRTPTPHGVSERRTLRASELAGALFREHGSNGKQVYEVFLRLGDDHSVDVDDVAEIYVKEVMKTPGPARETLKSHSDLSALLIRVMDEGWTRDSEQECIDFLKGLAQAGN